MMRKQIYTNRHREVMLKCQAKLRGVSEAELTCRAVDCKTELGQLFAAQYDHSAWGEILKLVEARKQLGVTGTPHQWNRLEIYAECEDFRED